MKLFEKWETEDLELTFGLQKVEPLAAMEAWLSANELITESEGEKVEELRKILREEVDFWNEEEVKFFFISDMIKLVNFRKLNAYKTFAQRTLAAKIKNLKGEEIDTRGRIELIVSAGKQRPRQPFFFIHEYKPKKGSANDPLGQLLSAMLVTQNMNDNQMPLYGVYVLGQLWHFVVLDDKKYCMADAFDATQKEDIFRILTMLKACKSSIERALAS